MSDSLFVNKDNMRELMQNADQFLQKELEETRRRFLETILDRITDAAKRGEDKCEITTWSDLEASLLEEEIADSIRARGFEIGPIVAENTIVTYYTFSVSW